MWVDYQMKSSAGGGLKASHSSGVIPVMMMVFIVWGWRNTPCCSRQLLGWESRVGRLRDYGLGVALQTIDEIVPKSDLRFKAFHLVTFWGTPFISILDLGVNSFGNGV